MAAASSDKGSPGSLVTKHLYYDDTELFSNVGKVIAQYAGSKEGQTVIVLDQTVMHPQGGNWPLYCGLSIVNSVCWVLL